LNYLELKSAIKMTFLISVFVVVAPLVRADEIDAKNFITVATGIVPSSSDPRITVVNSQLEAIRASCATTSQGAAFHDKLAKGHSLLTVSQPLLGLLSDFVRITRAQCSRVADSALISLYVIERNDGVSHAATVATLIKNPMGVVSKWQSR
jgi:hypothetical protein